MAVVKLPELPKCDICQALDLGKPHDATADSPLNWDVRVRWGYSCDIHARYRLSPITYLEVES